MLCVLGLESDGTNKDQCILKPHTRQHYPCCLRLGNYDRNSAMIGHAMVNNYQPPDPESGDSNAPPTFEAQDPAFSRMRVVRTSAGSPGAFDIDDGALWQRPVISTANGGREPAARPHRSSRRMRVPIPERNAPEYSEEGSGARASSHAREGVTVAREMDDRGNKGAGARAEQTVHTVQAAGDKRRTYTGSASSLQADRWDPAV